MATQRQVQDIDKIDDMIQSLAKHMVEKVERNVLMMMVGIKKRADVDEFVRNVDGELSDLQCEIVSKLQARPRQVLHVGSLRSSSSNIVSTVTATDIDLDKRAGELSTHDVNKIETVLNNSCHFKIPAHMLNRSGAHDISIVCNVTDKESFSNVKAWMSEIDKHVSDGVNKFLIENKCGLTSQEELPTDEAEEHADSLKRAI